MWPFNTGDYFMFDCTLYLTNIGKYTFVLPIDGHKDYNSRLD